ncbi:tRNA dimethylallyltransferase 1 [Fulvitalea axinellae]|uniref:tRNA dimethylallyltransferase n=1 Tax=Fulvitalea axinellae TaxID=1182444 RepID=A0AAU9CM19_9BACT|nr:tRNA dimethylallyltransferase 1 [Fulvitalea axinellae]
MNLEKNKLIVIEGPTAVGKTALCVNLAKKLGTEVVSADSRQFFKEMAIGTAKPTVEEMDGVKHHFVNCRSVKEPYSAGSYEVDALEVIGKLFETHDSVILTGGSGLYIQAVCDGMDAFPPIPTEIRDRWTRRIDEEGVTKIAQELAEADPATYELVDTLNPRRVLRAMEVLEVTGKGLAEWHSGTKPRDFDIVRIGLERDREELYERINLRVDLMLEAGLMDEVKRLTQWKELTALKTVGYKEIFGYLDGEYDMEEAIRLVKRNTRRYAKRQLSWFKRDEEMTWFHPEDEAGIINHINAHS